MSNKSPKTFDCRIGRLLKMQRIAANLSQEELGNRIGVTFQQIQKYENGTNRISASRLQSISAVLGVHPNFFFEEEKFTELSAHIQDSLPPLNSTLFMTKEWRNLSSAYSSIRDPAMRQKISEIVMVLAKLDGARASAGEPPNAA